MTSIPSDGKKPMQPLNVVGALAGGMIGVYCGLAILIPLAGGAIVLSQNKRFAAARWAPFLTAVAVIFGHLVWMLVGALILPAQFMVIAIDMVIMAVGLLWLVLRPGLGPVILLGIFEVVCLVVNANTILAMEFGSAGHKALVAHIVLRLAALAALVTGYVKFKKDQLQAQAETQVQTPPPPLPPSN